MSQDSETRELSTLFVDAIITIPGTEKKVRLVAFTQPLKYSSGIWAVADPESGKFLQLVEDGRGVFADTTG